MRIEHRREARKQARLDCMAKIIRARRENIDEAAFASVVSVLVDSLVSDEAADPIVGSEGQPWSDAEIEILRREFKFIPMGDWQARSAAIDRCSEQIQRTRAAIVAAENRFLS
jgi:hypothetical protein